MNFQKLILILLLFIVVKCTGQNYIFIYHLGENLNTVPKDKAVIIGKGYIQGNTMILDCFTTDKLIKVVSATFTDSSLSNLNGLYRSYYADNKIESEGNYINNDMEGVWKYRDVNGLITDSMIYTKGTCTAYAAYKYNFSKPTLKQLLLNPYLKDTLTSYLYSFTDSLRNTFTEKEVSVKNGKEIINFEADFIGERGLLKEYDSTGAVKTDSVFTRKLQEASFVGGDQGWRDLLRVNLNPLIPAENNAPNGKYTVIIRFIINPDGTVKDLKAENDPGYGMAEEAIRVMKKSKWQPAIKYGKYQFAYRRQPVTFLIEGEGR